MVGVRIPAGSPFLKERKLLLHVTRHDYHTGEEQQIPVRTYSMLLSVAYTALQESISQLKTPKSLFFIHKGARESIISTLRVMTNILPNVFYDYLHGIVLVLFWGFLSYCMALYCGFAWGESSQFDDLAQLVVMVASTIAILVFMLHMIKITVKIYYLREAVRVVHQELGYLSTTLDAMGKDDLEEVCKVLEDMMRNPEDYGE